VINVWRYTSTSHVHLFKNVLPTLNQTAYL
jgi:hypothetical protein